MGWFQYGSTIIVFASDGFKLCEHVKKEPSSAARLRAVSAATGFLA